MALERLDFSKNGLEEFVSRLVDALLEFFGGEGQHDFSVENRSLSHVRLLVHALQGAVLALVVLVSCNPLLRNLVHHSMAPLRSERSSVRVDLRAVVGIEVLLLFITGAGN